ncbi:uncharacterized protein LOC132061139 [Lycium ferocissimum]|uniref:uncharacterized protein LOC132061139 n=1 Tax=Lycium ferocissimum TaxID=112874 RepID=UPI0028166B0E|nr:uncharacterized protein LOC132061139 [Lycium ferocissimum]
MAVERQVQLVKPYTRKEVKDAMFGININKSPGPDGFGSGFFRDTWALTGEDITEAILETLSTGKMLHQLNATSIALIPKVINPENAGQFRPIACCNVVYKCISKMLCKRLKQILPALVSDTQSSFVSGITLVHNVLICHDLMRHYNRKTTPRCLVKIDLRKAYDMMKWEFIEEMLHGFGFPIKFIQLVMLCVTTTKFSIKVNGNSHGYFEGRRGLRQGDPISPLLFVLVMEYLSRVLKKMGNLPNFRFHPMCKKMQLTHLTFADDLMKFCKATETSIHFPSGIWDYYCHLRSGTNWSVINCVLRSLKESEGAVFILSQSVLKEVDKLYRGFLWGNTEETRKINLVDWEKICRPKGQCGLNIKGYKFWNLASVGKLIWWIVEKTDLLWVKWVHGIYMNNTDDFWNHIPPSDCSWYWKKLHKIKSRMTNWHSNGHYCLTTSGKYSVGNGYQDLLRARAKVETANLIWTSIALPKHRFILWLAAQERLLTKVRVHGMGLKCDTIEFELCAENEKQKVQETLLGIKSKKWSRFRKKVLTAIYGATIYNIWTARNQKIFRGHTVQSKFIFGANTICS